jgi:hypothetical protein
LAVHQIADRAAESTTSTRRIARSDGIAQYDTLFAGGEGAIAAPERGLPSGEAR